MHGCTIMMLVVPLRPMEVLWVLVVVASTTMATPTQTAVTDPIHTLSSNSFSFALHNVIDNIP